MTPSGIGEGMSSGHKGLAKSLGFKDRHSIREVHEDWLAAVCQLWWPGYVLASGYEEDKGWQVRYLVMMMPSLGPDGAVCRRVLWWWYWYSTEAWYSHGPQGLDNCVLFAFMLLVWGLVYEAQVDLEPLCLQAALYLSVFTWCCLGWCVLQFLLLSEDSGYACVAAGLLVLIQRLGDKH